jgi:hypothetical protein
MMCDGVCGSYSIREWSVGLAFGCIGELLEGEPLNIDIDGALNIR